MGKKIRLSWCPKVEMERNGDVLRKIEVYSIARLATVRKCESRTAYMWFV